MVSDRKVRDRHALILLLLEDDDDDYILTLEAVDHDERAATRIYRVEDGVEGMAYLRGGEGMADGPDGHKVCYCDCPTPDIIIVDLEMPRMDGREFIATLKEQRAWSRIPVVVLTNSQDERDVLLSYDIGAAAYIVKPLDIAEMGAVVRQIRDFYLTIVRLPRRGD